MQDITEETELLGSLALQIFGQGFEAKIKDQLESLKMLEKSRVKSPPPKKKKSFFDRDIPRIPKERWQFQQRQKTVVPQVTSLRK